MAAVRIMSTSSSSSSSSTSTSYLFIMIIFLSFSNLVMSQTNVADMLLELKSDFENTGPLDSTWKKGTNPCDQKKKWIGVTCREGVVRVLRLSGYNLSGEFNVDAIAQIRGLRTLSIGKNGFSGPIPEFHLIGGLRDLIANDNSFSGEIAPTFFGTKQPSKLRTIDLSSNQLSGNIPESLVSSTPNLQELQLQGNGFSGPVPLFKQKMLTKCNLASNKLEGEIPEEMIAKYGADSFKENSGLCSAKIGKECPKPNNSGSGHTKWIVLGVIIVIFLITLLIKKTRKNDSFTPLEKENGDHEGVHMLKAMSRNRTLSINRRGGPSIESTSRKSSRNGRGSGELIIVNDERGSFGLTDLMKAAAEVLGNGSLGSAYKAVMGNGVSVVVKRMRDMNKLNKDEFYMEMKRLGGLRHKNILPPLGYHYRKEEKLVVSEYVPKGSLLYLLHGDRGIAHQELTWPIRLKIIKGVAQGISFLHSEFSTYELPHGNLKSSNILLSGNYEPLLTDYSLHPMFDTTQAAETMFAYRSPEGVQRQVSPKSDVFCLGIIILEILSGKFPSQYLSSKKGGTDVIQWARLVVSENRETELIDPEIASAGASSIEEMVELLHIGVDCTADEHDRRIHMEEAASRIDDIQA
ncbi:transmembrane signal receptor [Lithospermum erythrorhizon]|uniref:Transmembrane signal receptor n=1 Tax=Lithospermum erythrorhizon TaxID=34254 RepID=A0AAV3QFZ0_LITER